jgi:hypothetical protein
VNELLPGRARRPKKEPARADDQDGRDNLIPLPTAAADPAGAAATALKIRSSLSLLQGYADFLQDASPAVQSEVLKAMAAKSQTLVDMLRPFLQLTAASSQPVGEYRRVRERTRQLMGEYRRLLSRLEVNLEATDRVAEAGLPRAGVEPRG